MRRISAIDGVPLALGAYLAALVFVAWFGRFSYPYDLEWMEGGMLAHAWRLTEGYAPYGPPDATWIPFVYPPGQPAVVAAFGAVFGLTPAVGRLVSIAGTLAACAALGFAGWRQGSVMAGILGAAAFLTCYPDSGAFYDLIRPDALGVGLAGWAIVLGLEPSRRARIGAALLLVGAFTVKHNLAVFGVPMALGIWALRGWREAWIFGLTAALPALAFTVLLEATSADALPVGPFAGVLLAGLVAAGVGARWGAQKAAWAGAVGLLPALVGAALMLRDVGHFQRTILGIPGAHPMVFGRLIPGSVEELGGSVGVLLAGCTLALIAGTTRISGSWAVPLGALVGGGLGALGLQLPDAEGVPRVPALAEATAWVCLGAATSTALLGLGFAAVQRRIEGRWVYGLGVALAAAVGAALMRAHHGGFINVFIPMHWVVAFATVSALAQSRRVWPSSWVWVAGAAVVTAQLATKRDFDPARYVPDARDEAAGDAFVEALRGCDGPILSPFAAWLPVYVGQAPSLHLIALWDVNHKASPYRPVVEQVTRAADARAWACVVDGDGRPLGYGVQKNYEASVVPDVPAPSSMNRPRVFMPKTGWRVRPKTVLVPKESR